MVTGSDVDGAPRVLIVEDDERLAQLIKDYLSNNGYQVQVEHHGGLALQAVSSMQPDIVMLDVMLPGEDGLVICQKLRARYQGYIMMLTARTDDIDQVLGLEMGADDYLCKPVQPRLLLARIKAALRGKYGGHGTGNNGVNQLHQQRYHIGELVVDNASREVQLADQQVELTSAEFDLLWLLISNAGRVLTREEIFNALRGIAYDGQDRSIDVRVSRIRPKIGDDPDHPRLIKTVRSRGYLFVRDRS